MDVRDEYQERHQRLRTRRNADFGRLSHSVDGVAASIGQRDDLGARILCRIQMLEEASWRLTDAANGR